MIYEMLRKEVTNKLKENEIKEGISLINNFISENGLTKSGFAQTFINIERRYNELSSKDIKGLINFEAASIFRSRIVDDILNLLTNENFKTEEKLKINTELGSIDIWVEIKDDFEEFRKDENKIKLFLDRIQKLLEIDNEVKIRQMKPGSVWILLNLPIKSAFKLFKQAKEGKLIDLNVVDAHFWIESKQKHTNDWMSIKFDKSVSYEELGFQFGLLGEEKVKNEFVDKYKSLYEEKIKIEREQRNKIESNLYRELENIQNKIDKKNFDIDRLRKSISILEFMTLETQIGTGYGSDSDSFENVFIKNNISNKTIQLNVMIKEVSGLQEMIVQLNHRLTEYITYDKGDWEYRVSNVVEEIERGFAYGLVTRKINFIAN